LSEVIDERSCYDCVRDASTVRKLECRQLVSLSLESDDRCTNIANHLEQSTKKQSQHFDCRFRERNVTHVLIPQAYSTNLSINLTLKTVIAAPKANPSDAKERTMIAIGITTLRLPTIHTR